VLIANIAFVLLLFKELKISAFDPDLATTLGINATLLHYLLMIMVAITTVANFESVGSILVIAMLIVPAATAHLLTDRLGVMIVLSLVIAAASAVVGHLLAVWGPGWVGYDPSISVNTAAMMAVVAGGLLGITLLLSPHEGLISKAYHRLALSLQIVREDILGLLYRWHELQPEQGRPMKRREILEAIGAGWLAKWALRSLRAAMLVEYRAADSDGAGAGIQLTDRGVGRASQLVRSHRLWETYLAEHFVLPLDHLHMPAERMEHYITPDMQETLDTQLESADRDPHGKAIPKSRP
jgi:manganese/zinc/iron transport system permease protein